MMQGWRITLSASQLDSYYMISHTNREPTKPSRVVLLGARGFIGKAVLRRLEMESIPTLALGSGDLDLCDSSASKRLVGIIQDGDSVVMLSALTPDKGRDITTLMKNLVMMQTVCSALEESECAHLIYFSSDAVYNTDLNRVTEDSPASPRDLYGAMHHTREIMARSVGDIPTLILRPTAVYGPNEPHNSYGPNRFRQAAESYGKITLFGGGEETRDHIHVKDVAEVTLRSLLHKSSGILNVATGASKSFYEVAETVVRQFDNGVEVITTSRANPITHRHYDVTNLIKAFPDFRFTDLESGIASTHKEST